MPSSTEHSFYEILSLPKPDAGQTFSKDDLKQAYHRALLLHHPDKLSSGNTASVSKPSTGVQVYSVDDIALAYKTLAEPTLRSEYDRQLRLLESKTKSLDGETQFHTGLDSIDLDDLDYDDSLGIWSRSCRCGDQRGFQITEVELEKAAGEGEVLTGCKGCSLWLRVSFALSE